MRAVKQRSAISRAGRHSLKQSSLNLKNFLPMQSNETEHMAIIKATYTKKGDAAKASIRYIAHRPGKEGSKVSRILFGSDGAMGRWQAYTLIDQAEKGSFFFRFVISPDPKAEDSQRDLHLRTVTEQTMNALEELLEKPVIWVAAEHDDHAPHRHVHVVAVVPEKLYVQDFQRLRQVATEAALHQRQERDLLQEQDKDRREEAQWE